MHKKKIENNIEIIKMMCKNFKKQIFARYFIEITSFTESDIPNLMTCYGYISLALKATVKCLIQRCC